MRKYFIPVLLLISLASFAQTFTATTGLPANIPSSQDIPTCYNLNVSGIGTIGTSKGLSQVCLTINHTSVQELEILLQAPDGTYVPLSIQNGGTGDNYTSTCFSAASNNPIKFNSPPFTGTFLPEGHLGAVNNGQNADGIWKLCILDGAGAAVGSLREWSITFNTNPAPPPPSFPNCIRTIPSSSDCATASSICDFNGICGSTPQQAPTTKKSWPDLDAKSCFGIQNNSFIKFIASSSTVSFSVWVPQSNTGFNNRTGGIQMLFFSTPTCGGIVTTHGCYDRIYPYHPNGKELINLIYATNLTPGNTYYLVIDGRNGDQCNFRIAANSGVNALNITPSSTDICLGQTITLNASGGDGNYSWGANNNTAAGLSATTGSNVSAKPTTTGPIRYSLTSTLGLCGMTSISIDVNVNDVPAKPEINSTLASCTAAGTSTINNFSNTLTYTFNPSGPTIGTNGIINGMITGTNYTVSASDGTCNSPVSNSFSNAAPTGITQSYVYSIIDPTCTNNTGGIVIQQPLGNNYEYNLNGGAYQSTPSFSNLTSGNYTTSVRDKTTGCVSPASPFTVKAAPVVPAAPAITPVQPTCALPTGSISITTISGLTYSIDGNIYQSGNVFSGLNPGSYSVTAKNADGCISSSTPAVLVQPTCITTNDLFVPNAFTPNGDGKNDILFVKGTSIKSMQFLIYNQWGEKVFESTRQDTGWDGTASGKSQPVGVYVYVLKAELLDGSTQQLKGSITLIR
jgi:gliding motility-associated-like protein